MYELPLLPNNTASETFLHKSGAVRKVDWIFITGGPDLVGNRRVRDIGKKFYNRLFEQKREQQPQLPPHFLPYRITQEGSD